MEAKYYIFAKGYEGMWQAFVKLSLAELFLIISKEMRHASKNAKNNHEKKGIITNRFHQRFSFNIV